jgi:hypothetical protein
VLLHILPLGDDVPTAILAIKCFVVPATNWSLCPWFYQILGKEGNGGRFYLRNMSARYYLLDDLIR